VVALLAVLHDQTRGDGRVWRLLGRKENRAVCLHDVAQQLLVRAIDVAHRHVTVRLVRHLGSVADHLRHLLARLPVPRAEELERSRVHRVRLDALDAADHNAALGADLHLDRLGVRERLRQLRDDGLLPRDRRVAWQREQERRMEWMRRVGIVLAAMLIEPRCPWNVARDLDELAEQWLGQDKVSPAHSRGTK